MFRRPFAFVFLLSLSFIILFSCSENHKSIDDSNHRTSKYGSNTDEKFDDPGEFIKLFEMPIRKINGSSQFDVLY